MVTQQETSTPMQEWVAQALERMQPVLDGVIVTGGPQRRAEAMTDIMDRVEWLVMHFKVLPEPCCHASLCHLTAYAEGHSAGYIEAIMWARNEIREIGSKMEDKNES